MTFAEEATDLITSVFGPLTPAHGVSDKTMAAAEKRLGIKLPAPLADYYRLAGKHKQVSDGMNHLRKPSELELSDGALVFQDENQGVFSSAVMAAELGEEDPPAYERSDGEREWRLAAARLSRYLLVTFCWQACNALHASASATATPEQLDRMKQALRWASFGADPKADTVGLWTGQVAVVAFTDDHELYLASHSDDELDAFAEKWGLELSYN
jgi:hypothetical protein